MEQERECDYSNKTCLIKYNIYLKNFQLKVSNSSKKEK